MGLLTACAFATSLTAQVASAVNRLATLTGYVVSDDGRPVAGARISVVRLFAAAAGQSWPHAWPVDSDAAGRFTVSALPTGAFSVEVWDRPGFVGRQPIAVEVTGGRTTTIAIRLVRTGTITGRVLDAADQPLRHAMVRAIALGSLVMRSARLAGGALVDEEGRFRVQVPPGDYYVAIDPASFRPSGPLPPRTGYVSAYYPGSGLDEARVVTVRSGQETSGIDASLKPAPLSTVTVAAVDSAGHALDATDIVGMYRVGDEGAAADLARRQPDGTFVAREVAPGDRLLLAQMSRPGVPRADVEEAYLRVRVTGDDLSLRIQTNRGATLSGRVVAEGAESGGREAVPSAAVSWMPSDVPGLRVRPSASLLTRGGEDGAFTLTGLRGRGSLKATNAPMAVKEVTVGGEDVTGGAMELAGTECIDDALIIMTRRTSRIRGTVTDADGKPASAWVVLFPANPEQWVPLSPHVHTARTQRPAAATPARQPVTFMLSAIPPGHYFIAAVDTDAAPWLDRRSLDWLRSRATAVTLEDGKTTAVGLKVVPR